MYATCICLLLHTRIRDCSTHLNVSIAYLIVVVIVGMKCFFILVSSM